jgi:cytoskeletal protein RodZ
MKANFCADEFVARKSNSRHETEPQQANGEVSTKSSQDTPGRSSDEEKIQKEKGTL